MRPEPSNSLCAVRLFKCLADEDLERLAQQCRQNVFARDQVVIDAGSACKDVLFVIEGRVRVVDRTECGRDVTLGEWREGDHIGELAALDGGSRTASVVAVTDCCVAIMQSATFREVLHEHSCVGLALLEDLTTIIRQADQRISELSTLCANQRLCRELLRHAKQLPNDDQLREIDPLPTQEALASVTGMTRESVARLLGQLRHEGLIKRTGSRLLITDVEQVSLLAKGQSIRSKRTPS